MWFLVEPKFEFLICISMKQVQNQKSQKAHCDLFLPEGSEVFDLNELKVLSWLNPQKYSQEAHKI